jgi:hypothetical protein
MADWYEGRQGFLSIILQQADHVLNEWYSQYKYAVYGMPYVKKYENYS